MLTACRDRAPARRLAAAVTLLLALGAPAAPAATDDLQLPRLTYPEVTRLYRSGDAGAALARLDRTVGDAAAPALEALVLRALLLDAAGRGPESDAVWRQVIEREVWMRTFARRALVVSMAGRGEPEQAAPILAELTRGDAARHLDLTLLVGQAHLDRGEFDRAAARYRGALRTERRGANADQARLGLAAAQAARRRP